MPKTAKQQLILIDKNFGIYLHLPFCLSKCPYCSFFSIPADPQLQKKYVQALIIQIKSFAENNWCKSRTADTIFFGGGTPTTMPSKDLINLLKTIKESFSFSSETVETSLEVNPATVSEPDLQWLRKAGFNRISMGIQSFSDPLLRQLGRPHTANEAKTIIYQARKAGFTNLSLDLMYGIPGQSPASWRHTLNQALDLSPDHLSLYELTLEKNTPFAKLASQRQLILPCEEDILEMMEIISKTLPAKDYLRYEISNYAQAGKECRHNINYWQNGSYLGLGAGAVSCLSGKRCHSIEHVSQFCQAVNENNNPWREIETLDKEASFRETVIMGLRMLQGVSLENLENKYSLDPLNYYGTVLQNLIDNELLTLENKYLRLTEKSLPIADTVMANLV